MPETFNRNLQALARLTNEMLALADEGDRDRDDESCGILYGILRDMAYRLRGLTDEECEKHRRAGKWDLDDANNPDTPMTDAPVTDSPTD